MKGNNDADFFKELINETLSEASKTSDIEVLSSKLSDFFNNKCDKYEIPQFLYKSSLCCYRLVNTSIDNYQLIGEDNLYPFPLQVIQSAIKNLETNNPFVIKGADLEEVNFILETKYTDLDPINLEHFLVPVNGSYYYAITPKLPYQNKRLKMCVIFEKFYKSLKT